MLQKIILLTGIPGTGKTKIGNYLKDIHGFYHIDLEDPLVNSSPEFVQYVQNNFEPDTLIKQIQNSAKSAVITWGFYLDFSDQFRKVCFWIFVRRLILSGTFLF